MPADLISSSLIVCEKILAETEGVCSLIRIVDVFYVNTSMPELPPERQNLSISVYAQGRFRAGVKYDGMLQMRLERPSGEVKDVGPEMHIQHAPELIADAPQGFAVFAGMAVVPKSYLKSLGLTGPF